MARPMAWTLVKRGRVVIASVVYCMMSAGTKVANEVATVLVVKIRVSVMILCRICCGNYTPSIHTVRAVFSEQFSGYRPGGRMITPSFQRYDALCNQNARFCIDSLVAVEVIGPSIFSPAIGLGTREPTVRLTPSHRSLVSRF